MAALLPIALDLERRTCVIVGGGSVAARRARTLLECGATVRLVSPTVSTAVQALVADLRFEPREYEAGVLDGAILVVAATDDPAVNAAVCRDARERGILCCQSAEAEEGDFVFMAAVRRGDLLIGVTTGGASPSLTVRLRDQVAGQYGAEWADYTALLRDARERVIESVRDPALRRRLLNDLAADDTILSLLREGRAEEARARAFACISSS